MPVASHSESWPLDGVLLLLGKPSCLFPASRQPEHPRLPFTEFLQGFLGEAWSPDRNGAACGAEA